MTRAELVTVINRILNNSEMDSRYIPDLVSKKWYYDEIRKGLASGIIKGDVEGKVRPNDLITREEAITMIARAFVPDSGSPSVLSFEDADQISSWAKQYVSDFVYAKYISGYKDKTIKPKSNITRAEVAKIISRIIDIYGSYGAFTGNIKGDLLINGNGVILKDLTVYGNLIICEGATNISIEHVMVEGSLIYRVDLDLDKLTIKATKGEFDMRPVVEENKSVFQNEPYGISFSIPKKAKVVYADEDSKINYSQKNLMVIRINKDDELYYKSFANGLFAERNRYAKAYQEVKTGYIGRYRYAIYGDDKDESHFLYIKRDNVEYSIYFFNIENIDVIETLVESIRFFAGSKIDEHVVKTYYNDKLYLKFNYLDLVSVDDSYNTGIVNEEESEYKMFIQVTNIVDLSNYTTEQLKTILVDLEDTSSEIIESSIKKVYIYDAIEYVTKNDGKLTRSLYVIIANKLYHFIFTADEAKMAGAGVELYDDIISNIEFK